MNKLYSIFFIVVLMSCGKEGEDIGGEREDMFVNHKWLWSDYTEKDKSGMVVSDFSSIPESNKDDYYIFFENRKMERNQGQFINPNNPRQIPEWGTWKFTKLGKGLLLQTNLSGMEGYDIDIIYLSYYSLQFSMRDAVTGNLKIYTFRLVA